MVPDGKDPALRNVNALRSTTSENIDPPRPTIAGLTFSQYSSTRFAATSERTVCTPPNVTKPPREDAFKRRTWSAPSPAASVEFSQAPTSELLSVDSTNFGVAFIQAAKSPSAVVQ